MSAKIDQTNLIAALCLYFCLMIGVSGQTNRSPKDEVEEDRLLRAAIIKIESTPEFALADNFTFTKKIVDLNADGRREVVVWVPEPDLGGTSGYSILILSRSGKGYQKIMDIEQGWTPVIALPVKGNGWRDVAFQIGGGGAAWQYMIYQFNGRRYKYLRTQKSRPEGEVLIEKNWSQTMFGPDPGE